MRRAVFRLRWRSLVVLLFVALTLCVLKWGDRLLIAGDSVPSHAEVLVVLQGSVLAENARLAGAEHLLQQGTADRVLVSIPREGYWGQAIKPLAHNYIESTFGSGAANHTEFCESGPEVNSTAQEAVRLIECIQKQSWHSVIVVTSDYHTRRARMIWEDTIHRERAPIEIWVHGVPDPEFRAERWWRDRLSAKTWFFECTKLLWTVGGGIG